ncbi:hypothetical protein E3N88_22655 [Mikania micrantha]|uniref:Uncharacterized protein n=1 Tax=Mikania micrantha TaxID=192012 RepID=A0A5N6NBA1_9ASTR|nr:hypothetical protein E3N88_22655 [Mikania micrantha]
MSNDLRSCFYIWYYIADITSPSTLTRDEEQQVVSSPASKNRRLKPMDDMIHYDEEIHIRPRENCQYWHWIPDIIRSWMREKRVLPPHTPDTTTSSWTLPTLRYSPKQAFAACVARMNREIHNMREAAG